jgi:S-DNA-T family DNA segregation ATPase FtsK/SpoIIIE
MLDRTRLGRRGRDAALVVAWMFLALSLLGYDPADPPGSVATPPRPGPANPCGPVGAAIAFAAVQTLGFGVYLTLPAAAGLFLLRIRGRRVPEPGLRALGFGLVVVVVSALIQALDEHRRTATFPNTPPIGGGGHVGATLVGILGSQLGGAGMLLILSAAGLAGLALCGEALIVWPFRELSALIRRGRTAPSAVVEPAGTLATARFEVLNEAPRLPRVAMEAVAAPPPRVALPERVPAERPAVAGTPLPATPGDGSYRLPPMELLEPAAAVPVQEHEAMVHARAMLLERTLLEHGCQVRVVQIDTGPVITQFEIELEPGLRVSKIVGLASDLAIALAVPSVRIVAPIPGKTTVGIEVPNERRTMVRLGEVLTSGGPRLDGLRVPLFLGKDVKGNPLAFDLADMPHLLIAGRTGTGKSVCLNAMILSILMTRRPDEVKLILIDPKFVELTQFRRVPHLMHPVITDMKKAESILAWACEKMDERYNFLARAGVRNLQAYNALGAEEIYNRLRPEDEEEAKRIPTYMPYIVIIADEMSELMYTAPKEVEAHIVRLAQKARAVGMHLIVATQKPTVDVITGLIKGNLPARIAFQVASRGDSRVILDEMGADKLLGNGDMLFLIPGTSHIVRAQGTYVSDAEVNRICEYLGQYPVEFSKELVQLQVGGGAGGKERGAALKERDELYEPAIEIIIREGRGSTSLLQRALGIGYGRAARLIDYMAEDGIVGEYKGSTAREVLYTWDEWEALKNGGEPNVPAA